MSNETEMIKGAPPIPPPMEETDPELAEFFHRLVDYQVQNKKDGKLSHFSVDRYIAQGVGRNDPCPCGSTNADGKPIKFKKCCMSEYQ